MLKPPEIDVAVAHRYFSSHCFNQAWDLIEKSNRTPDDDRMMLVLAQASLYHWLQRPDCSPQNLSIGYWQQSRIHALLGNAPEARKTGELSLQFAEALAPFFKAYAFEALARSAHVARDQASLEMYLKLARQLAAEVSEKGEQEMLIKDLDSLC